MLFFLKEIYSIIFLITAEHKTFTKKDAYLYAN